MNKHRKDHNAIFEAFQQVQKKEQLVNESGMHLNEKGGWWDKTLAKSPIVNKLAGGVADRAGSRVTVKGDVNLMTKKFNQSLGRSKGPVNAQQLMTWLGRTSGLGSKVEQAPAVKDLLAKVQSGMINHKDVVKSFTGVVDDLHNIKDGGIASEPAGEPEEKFAFGQDNPDTTNDAGNYQYTPPSSSDAQSTGDSEEIKDKIDDINSDLNDDQPETPSERDALLAQIEDLRQQLAQAREQVPTAAQAQDSAPQARQETPQELPDAAVSEPEASQASTSTAIAEPQIEEPAAPTPTREPLRDPNPGPNTSEEPQIEEPNPGPNTSEEPQIEEPNPGPNTSEEPQIEEPNPGPNTSEEPAAPTPTREPLRDPNPGPNTSEEPAAPEPDAAPQAAAPFEEPTQAEIDEIPDTAPPAGDVPPAGNYPSSNAADGAAMSRIKAALDANQYPKQADVEAVMDSIDDPEVLKNFKIDGWSLEDLIDLAESFRLMIKNGLSLYSESTSSSQIQYAKTATRFIYKLNECVKATHSKRQRIINPGIGFMSQNWGRF
jgi:hypothetical protein